MRLWSIHPRYLDSKGLVALWREGLLAQNVLHGKTRGYRHHPQLERFKEAKDPRVLIGMYLWHVVDEATRRLYRFDSSKILTPRKTKGSLPVTRGQLKFETFHLLRKLEIRDQKKFAELGGRKLLRPHPLFRAVPGPIEDWEKAPPPAGKM